uniref:Uncharacterized protein n=1 Tax=Acrobeloides nanus TaxID=290746 RepID=A0A914DR74_9BILA
MKQGSAERKRANGRKRRLYASLTLGRHLPVYICEIVPCVEACCPLYLMWLPFCWPKGACRKREIDAIEAMIRAKRVVNDQNNKFKAENILVGVEPEPSAREARAKQLN